MSEIDWDKAPEGAQAYMPKSYEWLEGWWKKKGDQCYFWSISMPNDGGWQSTYANPFDHKELVMRPSPAWSGEGLPPVGVVCEVDYCEQWQRCEVIAHFQQRCGMVAAFTVEVSDGAKSLDAFGADSFRPIRTPEQIAAGEREEAINRACADIDKLVAAYNMSIDCSAAIRATIEALYDAGYRKP